VLVALAVLAAAPVPVAHARARWDTQVLALVPRPGFPANAYPAPDGRVYEGTYDNPQGDASASRVLEYDPGNGTLLRSWTVTGQDLSGAHGVQVATSDAAGRLVLLDKSPARVLLLDRATGAQTTYATFEPGTVPNHAAWGPDGSLYVTDYEHAVLWRVPPRGGSPQAWLRDARLDGGPFGTTGIALAADRTTLLVGQQSQAGGGAGDPATGRLWSIPIAADGKPGPMRQLWESRPLDGPDAFGVARSGNVYVALLVANQIAVIGPDGAERERFPANPGTGDNGSAVPFDNPSSAHFLGTRLMVANQSYFAADPAHQAILDVETGEPGLPEYIPADAGPSAAVAAACTSRRVLTVRLPSSRARVRSVRVRIADRPARTLRGPRRTVRIDLRGLRAGRHTVRLTIRYADGRTVVRRRSFTTCARQKS
jgi:sugar lactone lactonase YvrE